MHIHILGICGTFMAGIAAIAREAGHRVTGSDANAWPPMSTQLEQLGIEVMSGYEPGHLQPAPDCVVVGNVVTRGNPAMEYILDQGLPYTSGPQWLSEQVLQGRWVLAVAGTHGKTTTSSMLAWILEHAGLNPGYLIGGVPRNFTTSARLGSTPFFVVEADEYDTAFFDKRSKFVHYRPRTAILNNLEFDHADIFPDLAAIERQFHHLVRTVPGGTGRIVCNGRDEALARVLKVGCWTPVEYFDHDDGWQVRLLEPDGSQFEVKFAGQVQGRVHWGLLGNHNVSNALAAVAAARHVGVTPAIALEALSRFENVKRRMELRGEVNGVRVYDDFAHHPTAIATTLAGVRAQARPGRIIAVLEPRSNTMRMGVHKAELAESLKGADLAFLYQREELDWSLANAGGGLDPRIKVMGNFDELLNAVTAAAQSGDQVVVMSNGDFGAIHAKLLRLLAADSRATGSS
jgi:UDP-N-acetylmuramate: L-alanyl-gamma-D-glutamyl-meso-diaminopimelate ligase